MRLRDPFIIGSDLRPALRIGAAEVSLELTGSRRGRAVFTWHVYLKGKEYSAADLTSPRADLQGAFGDLLSFLGAFAESQRYPKSENRDLFPAALAEWAAQESNEITSLGCWIEETPELIEE